MCNSEALREELVTLTAEVVKERELVAKLSQRVTELEAQLKPVVQFLNAKFGATIQQNVPQYAQATDRNETGMGAIVSADRSSFI